MNESGGYPSGLSGSVVGVSELPTYNYSSSGSSSATLAYSLPTSSYVILMFLGEGYNSRLPMYLSGSYLSQSGCTLESNETESISTGYYLGNTLVYLCAERAGAIASQFPRLPETAGSSR